MKDLKIRVADEAESKEAQELFFELGYYWAYKNLGKKLLLSKKDVYLFAESDGTLGTGMHQDEVFFNNWRGKEITLQELRDMVNPMKEYLEKPDESNIVSYYAFLENTRKIFKFNDVTVSIWRSVINETYDTVGVEWFIPNKYKQGNISYLINYGIFSSVKVIEKWENYKVKSNTVSLNYNPIVADVPFKGGLKSFLRTKGNYQVINSLDIEEKDVTNTIKYCNITFEELVGLRNEWLNYCKKLSDYQIEYLEWKKSQPKIVKKNTPSQRKFEGSIKFDTGRFHKHTRDCVFDAGYKTITDIKKEKTLYVYSTEKDELIDNWTLINHLKIVPVIIEGNKIGSFPLSTTESIILLTNS